MIILIVINKIKIIPNCIENLQKINKSKDFFYSQNTTNKQDTGLLGIESIAIKNSILRLEFQK